MAKITLEAKQVQTFKKGDLVLLRERQEHSPQYKRRAVIVTDDVQDGAYVFEGFCLVDCETVSTFRVSSFELADFPISLSN